MPQRPFRFVLSRPQRGAVIILLLVMSVVQLFGYLLSLLKKFHWI